MAAVFSIGTESAAGLMIDWICEGNPPGRSGFSQKQLATLVKQYPHVRADLLNRYASLPPARPHSLLEAVLREIADAEIVVAFVRDYARHKRPFDGNLAYAIRETAISKRPIADWPNAYNEFSVSLTALRKQLFAMVLENSAESTVAKACLNEIEELRDEYGRITDEPRHPDIASGHAWPLERFEGAGV